MLSIPHHLQRSRRRLAIFTTLALIGVTALVTPPAHAVDIVRTVRLDQVGGATFEGDPTEFTFGYDCAIVGQETLSEGESFELTLPTGSSCQINPQIDSDRYVVTPGSTTVDLDADHTLAFEISRRVGQIRIGKTFPNGGPNPGEAFLVDWECSFGSHSLTDTFTFTTAETQVTPVVPAESSCEVTEQPAPGYDSTVTPGQFTFDPNAGTAQTRVVTVSNARRTTPTGTLQVIKAVRGYTGETFTIDVSCQNASAATVFNDSFSVAGAGSETFTGIPAPATCTVTEQAVPGYSVIYSPSQTVQIPADQAVELTVTNSRQLQSFEISKTTEGGDGTFVFDWSCVAGPFSRSGTVTIDSTGSTPATESVTEIPTGATCSVTERPDPDWTATVVPANGQLVVGSGQTVVQFHNERRTSPLGVVKFYDSNLNGVHDPTEPTIAWRVSIGATSYDIPDESPIALAPGAYTVTEASATGWVATTPSSAPITMPGTTLVSFGNVCLGAGGARSIGYWSGPGKSAVTANDLATLRALPLVITSGAPFDPNSAQQVSAWLKNANATNMATMLSAQLVAMTLNVRHGLVSADAAVWTGSGFTTIGAVTLNATTSLAADGSTLAGDPNRGAQEQLKDVIDRTNRNTNFAQPTPCGSPFA